MLAREIIFEPLEEVLIDLLGVCVWAALCVKSVCSALVFDWSQLLKPENGWKFVLIEKLSCS